MHEIVKIGLSRWARIPSTPLDPPMLTLQTSTTQWRVQGYHEGTPCAIPKNQNFSFHGFLSVGNSRFRHFHVWPKIKHHWQIQEKARRHIFVSSAFNFILLVKIAKDNLSRTLRNPGYAATCGNNTTTSLCSFSLFQHFILFYFIFFVRKKPKIICQKS